METIPFEVTDWKGLPATRHEGETGFALWRTRQYGDLRVRLVEYSPGYRANHWCSIGHVLLCLEGELETELGDGKSVKLTAGMSYQVTDGASTHRSATSTGAKLFIVDGGFLEPFELKRTPMNSLKWFDRKLTFGLPKEMLPFYLDRLDGTLARLEKKVDGVLDTVLSTKPDGKWSVKQHIGHLSEVDVIANRRIKEMLDGAPELSPAVFEPLDYNPWPIGRVLEQFRERRQANLAAYKAIQESGLLRSSLHPRLKVMMTPVDLAWFDAEHDDHHLVKINEILFTFH